MIDDVDEPYSDGWWFKKLAKAHAARFDRLKLLWERFQGRPPLPELPNPKAAQGQKRAWDAFQRKSRTNYAELIVEAVRERMTPVNFLVAESPELTERGRLIWAENEMATEFPDILEQMLALSESYGIVGPPEPGSDIPVISGEDPRQVVTVQDPARPARTLAALKLYHDELTETDVAWLYLPGRARRATRKGSGTVLGRPLRFSPAAWTFDESSVSLPVPDVCVVPFRNRRGVGEFELHVDHLDRINHTLLDRMVIATMQAFRQRALKGAPDRDPETGEQIDYNERLPADPAALWLLPENVELWESGQVDLGPILSSIKDDVRDLSAVTRVPISYFHPDAAGGSAEGASLTREGLVFRAEDRTVRAGTAAARLQSLALRMTDPSARAKRLIITTEWAPVERLSLAERYDAATKAVSSGVPWETRMRTILGFGPEDITRMRTERIDDLLLTAPADDATVAANPRSPAGQPEAVLPQVTNEPSAALLGGSGAASSAGAVGAGAA